MSIPCGKVLALVKLDGKTVAVDILNLETGETIRVPRSQFHTWRGCLKNAVVTVDGVIRGKDCILPVMPLDKLGNDSSDSLSQVTRYTVMLEDIPVVTVNKITDSVIVHDGSKLPFALRSRDPLRASEVLLWISDRVNNINRTYMNMVYIARKVGRDREKVIRDSCGISFTDNFWIRTTDSIATWSELRDMRDSNLALSQVALTGKLSKGSDFLAGFTSLFTTKGYFSKALYGGFMYKLREDALLEYPAYLIGKAMGVSVSECALQGDYVRIKLFTSPSCSLVHGSELKQFYNTSDLLYNVFLHLGRKDFVSQMQRMYIFNYVIGNPDLHDDNYGFLYDPRTFELLSLSPCFDHNVAFQPGFQGLSRTTMGNSASLELDSLASMFIGRHPDIVVGLKNFDFSTVSRYLSKQQLSELKDRVNNLYSWSLD